MTSLTFFTNPMSRGRIVRWMLEELGAPYETELLEYGGSMKAPAYLAINPMGKVPAIRHGDVVVTETAAICAYLADAFPERGLAPPSGDPARGPYYRWLFFAAAPIEQIVIFQSLGVTVAPERRAMMGFGEVEVALAALEAAVSRGPHLAGGHFSAADLYVAAQLGWAMQFGMIDKRPAFVDFVAMHDARPAAVRAREIDDALLPPPPAA